MRDILDPADFWHGVSDGAQVFGNKAPVALPDTLSIVQDSGPVSVTVLANDFDPEGGELTLISATAALGTAIAQTNGTVTYTPPPGVTGFDTIVYEIADPLDQRQSGQVDVTITSDFSVSVTAQNTLTVTATGILDLTISGPVEFSGTSTVNTSDFSGGPLSLVPPAITGTPQAGNALSAQDGLWIYDIAAGAPTREWQWQRGGNPISGAVMETYTLTTADAGQDISVVETLNNPQGQRSTSSAAIAINGGAGFSPDADTALIGWWDASDTATITSTLNAVDVWTDKAGGAALEVPAGFQNPMTGTRSQNGLNVIDFSGTAVLEAARTLPGSGDVAIHMLLIIDSVDNPFAAVLAVDANNDMQIDANAASQFDGRLNLAGVGSSINLTGGPFQGAMILSAVFDRASTATAEVFVGNVSRGSTAYTAPIDPAVALMLMTNRSRNAWIDGAIGEVIITGDVTNRADHHDYLVTKWGIS